MPIGIKKLNINILLAGRTFRLPLMAVVLIGVLILLAGIGYFWWQKTGRFPQINLEPYLQKLSAGLLSIVVREKVEEKTEEKEEVKPEELEVTLPSPQVKTYEEKAEPGEGITHLARKALRDYLKEKGSDLNLTPEHKIYIEDYLKDRTGERWLMPGETLSFSEELITEAINKAQKLTPGQLENLKQYSKLVSSF